jgi:hypothetical protein
LTFALVGWALFAIVGVVYLSFRRHMARRVETLSEYVEFLFQNRNVYEDHRAKYIVMLQDAANKSPQGTLRDLAMHSKRSVDDMAGRLYQQSATANAFGRGLVHKWMNRDSAAEAVTEHLSERAKT